MLPEQKYGFPGWTPAHSKISINYVILMLLVIAAVYNVKVVNPVWFLVVFAIAAWYFQRLSFCIKNWMHYPDKTFEKKLFRYSLLYRVITGLLLALVAELTWGQPDYVGAVDAYAYRHEAVYVANHIRNLDFSTAYNLAVWFTGSIDNAGPPLLFGLLYAVFGKYYLVGSLGLALISSYGVVFLYRTARMIWGDQVGKTTGILFMHFPLALFFSTVYLKEGFVVFLVLYIAYIVTKSFHNRRLTISNFVLLIAAMTALFLFRTAVGALIALLVPTAFLVNRYKNSRTASITIGVLAAAAFTFSMYAMDEYQFFLDRIYSGERVGEQRTALLGVEGVDLFDYQLQDLALAPVYVGLSIVAPLPGMVDVGTVHHTPHDHNHYLYAGLFIWNVLAFFSVIGFYYAVKEKVFKSFMVWVFTSGYLYILIVTVMYTRDRFAYISMPLMLALAAVGIYKYRGKTYWILYLVVAGAMTLVWHYLRLTVRGM